MSISVQCAKCDKPLRAPDTAAGKKIRCPRCQSVVAVPTAEEEVFEVSDDNAAVTEKPSASKKRKAEDTGITQSPKRKSSRTENKAPAKRRSDDEEDEDGYGVDEDDAAERRSRKKRKRLRSDDDEYGDMRGVREREAHRGGLILALGIVSLLGACVCAFIGWGLGGFVVSMANIDLEKMANGAMDEEGHGMTMAGKVCAILAVGFGLINAIAGIALNLAKFN